MPTDKVDALSVKWREWWDDFWLDVARMCIAAAHEAQKEDAR